MVTGTIKILKLGIPLIPAWILSVGLCSAQGPCDSLTIDQVSYTAFDDSLLQVVVTNTSSNIFSYPGFVLLDMNGDTIARETVNFFGIGGQSVHLLSIHPMADMQGPFPIAGTLHLWTGFYQNFECAFPVTFDPCPPPPCHELVVSMGNFGGAVVNAMIDWEVLDSTGMAVDNGTFELSATGQQSDSDTTCIPPGNYELSIQSPLTTGGQLNYSVSDAGPWGSPAVSSNYQQGASSNSVSFSHLIACTDINNTVAEVRTNAGFTLQTSNEVLTVLRPEVSGPGIIRVLDMQGKLLVQENVLGDRTDIPLCADAGILLVTLEEGGITRRRKVFWNE